MVNAPSSAMRTSTPGSARPTVPKRWSSGRELVATVEVSVIP